MRIYNSVYDNLGDSPKHLLQKIEHYYSLDQWLFLLNIKVEFSLFFFAKYETINLKFVKQMKKMEHGQEIK